MPNDTQDTKPYNNDIGYVKRNYKKIIEALCYIADLKIAGEKSLLKYVAALRKLLNWLKRAITQRDLPVKLKFAVNALQARIIIPLADPNLIEQSKLDFGEKNLKLLAQLIRDVVANFLQSAEEGFTVTVQQIIVNAVNNDQGNGGDVIINHGAVQQFSKQVFDDLIYDIALNPKPSVPEFEPDLCRDNVEELVDATPNLIDDIADKIREEIYAFAQLFLAPFRDSIDSLVSIYTGTSGSSSYDDGFSELFGDEGEFFGLVLEDNGNMYNNGNLFFSPREQQPSTNPEKDYPDAPYWEPQSSEENDFIQIVSSDDSDIVKYVY